MSHAQALVGTVPLFLAIAVACRTVPSPCAKAGSATTFMPDRFDYQTDGTCRWRPSDGTVPQPFACGELLIQLCPHTSSEEAEDVAHELAATMLRNRAGPGRPGWVLVRVTRGQESSTLTAAYRDRRVEHASLNWTGARPRS